MSFVCAHLPSPWVLVPVVLMVAIVGIALLIRPLRAKWRRLTLARLAQQLGLAFHPRGWDYVRGFSRDLELFRRGDRYRATNVLTGVWRNTVVEIFDCVYDIERSGRLSRSHTRTVVSLEWPVEFPALMVGPDTRVGELLKPVGGSDVGFESDEFNRHFRVRSEDRKFAYDIVHARTMELLLRARETMRDLQVQIADQRGFFFRERTLAAERIRPLLDLAVDFDELIPDYVKKDYAQK